MSRTGGCMDIDECTESLPCGGSGCVNTAGSFLCNSTCSAGYVKVNGSCQDIDECAVGNGGCSGNNTVCVNTAGSLYCGSVFCGSGYQLVNGSCEDVNECAVGNGGCSGNTSLCVNKVSYFFCNEPCASGYYPAYP